jgi:hypothetical protein
MAGTISAELADEGAEILAYQGKWAERCVF